MILNADLNNVIIKEKEGVVNYCTEYDIKVQEYLIDELSKIIPKASFFGEEDTANNIKRVESKYIFYIDPIDGTTNFMFNYKNSCVSVGLLYDNEMIAGFVYNPFVSEMYKAIKNKGAFLNNIPLKINDKNIDNGIVAFGSDRNSVNKIDCYSKIIKQLFFKSVSVRNGGSAAIDLTRIAKNSNVIYIELKLKPYDYAAASIIIEEAGGVITKIGGGEISLTEPCSILAGTKKAHKEVMAIAKEKGYNSEF
jgi:myo-inositol-1(or 4)-monophosphatase